MSLQRKRFSYTTPFVKMVRQVLRKNSAKQISNEVFMSRLHKISLNFLAAVHGHRTFRRQIFCVHYISLFFKWVGKQKCDTDYANKATRS